MVPAFTCMQRNQNLLSDYCLISTGACDVCLTQTAAIWTSLVVGLVLLKADCLAYKAYLSYIYCYITNTKM